MYKFNKKKYSTEAEVAGDIDKVLEQYIDECKGFEKRYQEIIDNAQARADIFKLFPISLDIISKLKIKVEKEFTEEGLKNLDILEKKDIKALIKDVEKSIKLHKKSNEAQEKAINKYKNANNKLAVEFVKVLKESMTETIKIFEFQRLICEKFREVEQER